MADDKIYSVDEIRTLLQMVYSTSYEDKALAETIVTNISVEHNKCALLYLFSIVYDGDIRKLVKAKLNIFNSMIYEFSNVSEVITEMYGTSDTYKLNFIKAFLERRIDYLLPGNLTYKLEIYDKS